jgi:hypothetical protein
MLILPPACHKDGREAVLYQEFGLWVEKKGRSPLANPAKQAYNTQRLPINTKGGMHHDE